MIRSQVLLDTATHRRRHEDAGRCHDGVQTAEALEMRLDDFRAQFRFADVFDQWTFTTPQIAGLGIIVVGIVVLQLGGAAHG